MMSDIIETLKGIPSVKIPTLRRTENAFRNLASGAEMKVLFSGNQDHFSDEVVLERARDISEAYKQRTVLQTFQRKELEGILKPLAGGCRFVYFEQREIASHVYSWEDLVLTARPALFGLPYRFQAQEEPITIPNGHSFEAVNGFWSSFADQYHLWRAEVKRKF